MKRSATPAVARCLVPPPFSIPTFVPPMHFPPRLILCLALSLMPAVSAAELPPAVDRQVDFTRDIKPLLDGRCSRCHARGQSKGGFRIETRETILKGGESGPAVVEGKSGESYLIELVAAVDSQNVMPVEGDRLTATEVGMLRKWIDQGLPWEAGFHFSRGPQPAPLAPRHVELPAADNSAASNHPVDRLLAGYFSAHEIGAAPIVDDRTFARRVFFDLIGLLPTPAEIRAFEADPSGDKREQLVQRLLNDQQRYTDHWLTFWNDCLRNDYTGTGYIDGGRKQITSWLQRALYDNLPYDEFVRSLVAPTAENDGFIKGIVWRGVVNASQTPPVQAAQNVSQIFLGINLKCGVVPRQLYQRLETVRRLWFGGNLHRRQAGDASLRPTDRRDGAAQVSLSRAGFNRFRRAARAASTTIGRLAHQPPKRPLCPDDGQPTVGEAVGSRTRRAG